MTKKEPLKEIFKFWQEYDHIELRTQKIMST